MNRNNLLRIRVWDLPLRLFHWLLVIAIVGSFVSVKTDNMQLHVTFAMFLTGLLIFRLLWGFFGSSTALFRSFVPTPQRLWNYFKSGEHRKPYFGHSPIGALSVLAMLLVITIQLLTGLVADDEILTSGPLAGYVSSDFSLSATEFHTLNSNIVFGLIALHILAVLVYLFVKKENLTAAMITGTKTMELDESKPAARNKPVAFVISAIISAGLAYGLFHLT